ncbi:MAG TPA: DMT family transporter [Sulfurovum sp.]|nr:DMT family transporter [Sulfurovum sp.]
MTTANKNLFYTLLFFAMIGWGGSWVNAKILSDYINEFEMIFIRFGLTGLTMIPIIIYLKKSFYIDAKTLGLVTLTSIVFLAYMKYYFLGTKLGTASLGGALVTSLAPIITFVILVILRMKKLRRIDIFALVLGAFGVLTMLNVWTLGSSEIFVIHNLYFILASILWPILTILSAQSKQISPIVFTFYLYVITVVIDSLFFMDFSSMAIESFDSRFWVNILTLVLFASTFANTVYFLGIEKLGTSEVSSFIFLVPFSAIGLSAIFLGEEIGMPMVIGAIMTLMAVKIINNIKIFNKK